MGSKEHLRKDSKDNVNYALQKWSLSVATLKFITGHIRVKSNVTNGGNQRLHGIGIGKIASL